MLPSPPRKGRPSPFTSEERGWILDRCLGYRSPADGPGTAPPHKSLKLLLEQGKEKGLLPPWSDVEEVRQVARAWGRA